MKTFKHSGKCGDIIFSLPTIEMMGGGILYLPEHSPIGQNIYSNMKSLLEKLPYINEVRELESMLPCGAKVEGIDIDLDKHLEHPWRGRQNMVLRYWDVFGMIGDWKKPWLDLGLTCDKGYSVVNVTPRHRDNSRLNWKRVFSLISGPVFFVGTDSEYDVFCRSVAPVVRIECPTAYELAAVISGARAVYCNQSVVLALAQAMGKEYYCEFKPGKLNCRFYTSNEHELQ